MLIYCTEVKGNEARRQKQANLGSARADRKPGGHLPAPPGCPPRDVKTEAGKWGLAGTGVQEIVIGLIAASLSPGSSALL